MKKPRILSNKYYLYATEFFAGMSVMAVELGASRLLAPYFSSSQIVWTIIIGTIMIAMALGNIWGGRRADRDPNPDRLYLRLIVAAVWIAAIPVVGKYIIIAISGLLIVTISNSFLILAAFLACMIIFVFPLFLLGTVTPSLVKYTVDSLDDSGKVVGTLGAYNTIGSIIGTFLPTFVTIPAVGTSVTFLLFAGILLLLGLLYFISVKKMAVKCTAAVLLTALCSLLSAKDSFAFWEDSLLYEGESVYNYLQVKEDEQSIILSTNVLFGVQSIMMKEDSLTGMYYDYALAAPLMADILDGTDKNMLILGMGTGTYAKQCRNYFGDIQIKGVEIDQKISDLSREYFELPDDIETVTYDGRAYLQAADQKYDVIMVDAYQDITIPFQMSTAEFFRLVKAHLKENGVMVVNMNMQTEEPGSITDYLADTIAGEFGTVYTVDVANNTNRELFATDNAQVMEVFSKQLLQTENESLRAFLQKIEPSIQPYEGGSLLLTDDKAPVELLGMQVIDGIIENEVGYYKELFKEQGISGILEQLN
ncbi:MAG: fused MFS/spermidine synthase [Lachnospiraceae bacterium]